MQKQKWRNLEITATVLALKLAEEVGEIAKEVVELETSNRNRQQHMKRALDEIEQAEFILRQLKRRLDKHLTR